MPSLFIWPLFVALTISPVAISVYPLVAMPANTFRIRVIVDRHQDNRSLCYGYDGPTYKRSCVSIDGADDTKVWTKYIFMRVPGAYVATADLMRIEGAKERHYLARQNFEVIGGF